MKVPYETINAWQQQAVLADRYSEIDILKLADDFRKKQVIVFGAGTSGGQVLEALSLIAVPVRCCVDNAPHKQGGKLQGIPIYNPNFIADLDKDELIVLVASIYYSEIAGQLREMQLQDEVHFYDGLQLCEIIYELYNKKNVEFGESYHKDREIRHNIKVINYQVNNFCNSKCLMCNVWKKNDKQYFTVDEFRNILTDPLFANVEHIGITGGEPTLVENLPNYFRAAIDALPRLSGLSMISNSLNPDKVISDIEKINRMCLAHKKSFSVMLSLDGIGSAHDCNRGVSGSFNKVEQVLAFLKSSGITFSTGTTITKSNVWDLEEVLVYLRENGIYGRFRIAEFINRLDNHDNKNFIRNFNEDEIYQLLLFFSKLEYTYEQDETIKNTYRSIKNMLRGGKRLISCPYQEQRAVNLDCHGGLAYCAPKSKVIGNLMENSGIKLYTENLAYLEQYKQTYCDYCIHDYHGALSPELIHMKWEEQHWRQYFTIKQYMNRRNSFSIDINGEKPENFTIFIVGWYGTETVGDKAILGGIVDHYKARYPTARFMVSSLYPFVTERTLKELKINARVVPVFSKEFFLYASVANVVVAGGGPLMELDELSLILWAFDMAKKNDGKTVVYGCGIGPIYTEEKTEAVKNILAMGDEIYLRDDASVEHAHRLTGRKGIKNIGDPAIGFLQKFQTKNSKGKTRIACFLRELTTEYRAAVNMDEFYSFKDDLEQALAKNIINFCDTYDLIPYFYSMHNFAIGNDDRDFNINFTRKYFSGRKHFVERGLSTVESITQAMQTSHINLCMRFHSVVFAQTLGTDFIALDYTSGGKINGFLTDVGKINHMISMRSIIDDPCHIVRHYEQRNIVERR
ncbi:polysaccharide pyruvyl transferase family protein [Anaerospora sp.]|uniref:polysaccharide pyruvyl transferase family protein n=1 Tax=Anaerospora sp. TaxID=1960278 RepID=UPI0028977741|nr:polysaccharide pyruvyl transferase family protein [Anaerospora sp.]